MDIGAPELIIIAVIILLLFGPGKAADLGSSLGKGIREFRKSVKDDDGALRTDASATAASGVSSPADAGSSPSQRCGACGAPVRDGQKFCSACGTAVAPPSLPAQEAPAKDTAD